MFTVYHSNQLDILKSLLLAIIKQTPLSSPLHAEQILVQSPGMAQWLKLEIAKEQGIVANMEFPLPATFIWQMFTQMLEDVPKTSFFNKEAMTWKLTKLLPSLLDDSDFSELKRYLDDDSQGQKMYQLASKIADIYDQYLVYRPEWIKAWEEGCEIPELNNEMRWQGKLWQALYNHTLGLKQSPYHRANLYENFIDVLTSHHTKPQGLAKIERVFIFGVSALPPRYLDALKAIGEHIDVHYMFTNPCRYYWGDIRDKRYLAKRAAANNYRIKREVLEGEASLTLSLLAAEDEAEVGNSLLASMGKLGRDNLLLISELQCREIDQGFVEINRDSLLHHIQADILNLIEPESNPANENSELKQEIALDDRSISIEVCHSPMREVEVLHDRLLAMFEENPKLTPRDIIVMVADINEYSPAIQAVFGNAASKRFIPFAISDRSAQQESPILNTFMHLLGLPNSRCSANELLEILQVPAVLRRFELSDKEFEKIKFWTKEAGIRWGLDSKTASQFSLPKQQLNTWMFGLNRMLLGYAMPSEQGLFEGVMPYDEVQGLTASIAGKLAQFFQVLLNAQNQLSEPKIGHEWLVTLGKLLDDIFLLDVDEELSGKFIRDKLASWVAQLEEAQFEQKISLVVVQEYMKDKLNIVGVSQRFLAGQVNFCTLMPMRSIPFQVVCLLGMNDGDYPRAVAPIGFDLMVGRTRAGDRSRRDDDRYLFLEALQAAQLSLYISYIGRSIQDNSEKVPSVLVAELLQYCTQGYCLQGDKALAKEDSTKRLEKHLIYQNPLTPFSPDAFTNRGSYASEWLLVAKGEQIESLPFIASKPLPLINTSKVLELTELQHFFKLPVRYFFNHRLNVYFDGQEESISDTEPFDLDNLARYHLQNALFDHLIAHGVTEASIAAFYQKQRAAGLLPINHFGMLALEAEQSKMIEHCERLLPYLQNPIYALEVNLIIPTSFGNINLQGWLKNRYQRGQVLYRSGKLRAQERVATWIEHLCLSAAGQKDDTFFFASDKNISFAPLPIDEAKELLAMYIEGYFQGMQKPFAYLPKTAFAGCEVFFASKSVSIDDEATRMQAKNKMIQAYANGYNTVGEGENPYVARVWQQGEGEFFDEVIDTCHKLLAPIFHAVREEK